MNEGGKVLLAGDSAGQQYTTQRRQPALRPQGRDRLQPAARGHGPAALPAVVRLVLRWRRHQRRAAVLPGRLPRRGQRRSRRKAPRSTRSGVDDPFTGLSWGLDDPVFAGNTIRRSSFIATSGILPVDQFKQFESWPAARYDKPGGPFDPHTGTQYVYSQIADVSYKRLTREIAVPAAGGSMTFWTSYDTEADWDHLFVEARTPGGDDWTTLPDANGHTTTATGESCPAGWVDAAPAARPLPDVGRRRQLHPTGTTGAWNAASGNSAGWQQWSIDLSAYAGESVEISIAYASDWATQGIGVFLDDITLPDGTSTSFETGLDGWAITGPPDGQRTQRQQLHPDRRVRLPGRQHDRHAALAAAGLRAGGRLDCSRTQRGDGPGARPPAGVGGGQTPSAIAATRTRA